MVCSVVLQEVVVQLAKIGREYDFSDISRENYLAVNFIVGSSYFQLKEKI